MNKNRRIEPTFVSFLDIIPINGDWTAQDTIWFRERVEEKQFVSCIKSISHDQTEGVVKIGISLVDTSDPHTDVFIDKELVDAKRAVFHCIN